MTTFITRPSWVAAGHLPTTGAVASSPRATGGAPRDVPADPRPTAPDRAAPAAASPYGCVFEEYAASEYVGLGHLFIG